MPGLNLGDTFPDIQVNTTHGDFKFYDWMGDQWAILFSHPRDYTPVCTTELARIASLKPDFDKRNTKLIALSCDSVEDHKGWTKDIKCFMGASEDYPYPIIADPDRSLAKRFGMIDPDEKTETGMPLTCRAVFIIGPDKKLKLSILYPATTGRNFNELIRVIDSLQLTMHKKVATPADWEDGKKCMVIPSISTEEAKKIFGDVEVKEMPSGKEYMRFTPHPK